MSSPEEQPNGARERRNYTIEHGVQQLKQLLELLAAEAGEEIDLILAASALPALK